MPINISRNRATFTLLFLWVLLGTLHLAAIRFFWYWSLPWFDLFIHALGGLLLSATFAWMYSRLKGSHPSGGRVLLFVFGAALLWEGFEFLSGMTAINDPGFLFDTTTDIAAVVAGGVISRRLFV